MKSRVLVFAAMVAAQGVWAPGAWAQQNAPLGPLPALPGVDEQPNGREMAELGKLLFFDSRLSGDGSLACASCHDPSFGWSDGSDLARGYPGTMHWRNSQTVVNTAYVKVGLHWDAGLKSLEDQVHDAMGAGFVHNIDEMLASERLRQVPEYLERFRSIWDAEPTLARASQAIAAYERTLISDDSPFDRYMAGDKGALAPAAQRGMALFEGKANCIACHSGALATDEKFHNTSVPPGSNFAEEPLRQVTFRLQMRRNGLDPALADVLDRDPGRYLATGAPEDLGRFRTPPLRYLKYTAPYMHNGVFFDLREVVEFYNDGGTKDYFGTKSALIRPLGLNDAEIGDLVAFLESMSGSEIRQEYPRLPEYEAMPFPAATSSRPIIELAREVSVTKVSKAVVAEEPAPEPEQTRASAPEDDGPQISAQPGLVIVPAGTAIEQAPPKEEKSTEKVASSSGGERIVVVQRGDTLGSLANRYYGDFQQFRKIYNANREKIDNPNILKPGLRLTIPRN
ncbi:MAG: cytochrome c peroxidase [Pseudomonadota bacterium]